MTLKIAFRNIFRQKRRTLLTILTMFGGFTLGSVSIGWQTGGYSGIINMFTRNRLGHIQIHGKGYLDKPSLYNTLNNYPEIGKKILTVKGVETWAPRLYSAGLASVGEKSAGVRIIGIDPQMEQDTTRFDKKIINGNSFLKKPSHKAMLGKGLARIMKAKPGEQAVIVSQAADGSIANDIYEIIGIVESGDDITDRTSFYLHIKDAQDFLVLSNRVHEIAVIIDDISLVRKITKKIQDKLNNPEISVKPWQEFAKSFYQAMKADVQGMYIMLFIIMLIVAVGVLNTVLMSVLERRREYGLLKALGTKPLQIFALVLYEVNTLAVLSIVLGAGAGTLINYLLSIYGIQLPTTFTYGGIKFSKIYAEVNIQSLYIPSITVILSATLVSIFPAIKAARIDPAKAMRTH